MSPLRNTGGMTSDIWSHVEKTGTIADTHKMIDGRSQWIDRGTDDKHQAVSDPHLFQRPRTNADQSPGRRKVSNSDSRRIQRLTFVYSVSGESPPPPQRIFGRDELVKNVVDLADTDYPTPIALIGTGGIGKTSVALAVLHNDRIKQRFGDHRRLLRCDQFSASLPNFLRRLSEVIGAGIPNPPDLTSLRPSLSRNRMLIIIDNAESISGESTTKDIDAVVEELSQFRNIWLCITSRISIIPTRCEVIDVPTLSMEAARETFHSIYRRGEQSDAVDDILKQLDFHPLSIALLATAAKYNKWDIGQLEKEWEEQRTRYHGSLAAMIEFSLHSPTFQDLGPQARDLLGVVAFFPQGVDENNLDWLFPSVTDRKKIFGGFCVLSLTHRDKGFVTMLAPLRDHLCPKNPMSASLLRSVREHYFSRLSSSIKTLTPGDDGPTAWIASEDVNVEHLLDILTSIDVNSENVWDACGDFMAHLFYHKPRLPSFGPKIGALPDDYTPKPWCLWKLSNLCHMIGHSAECRRLLCHTLKLHRERGDSHEIASTLKQLAAINSSSNSCEEGIQQAKEAITIYQRLGDMTQVASCYAHLSRLFRRANRLEDAEKSESQAIGLIDALMPTADSMSRSSFHGDLRTIYSLRRDKKKLAFHVRATLAGASDRDTRFRLHSTLAAIHATEGRFDRAEAHLEHAETFAANSSYELGEVVLLRALFLRKQSKFEEARSEAPRALDLMEEFGGGDKVEEAKKVLQKIDEEMAERASVGEFQALLAHWNELRTVSLQKCGRDLPSLDTESRSLWLGRSSRPGNTQGCYKNDGAPRKRWQSHWRPQFLPNKKGSGGTRRTPKALEQQGSERGKCRESGYSHGCGRARRSAPTRTLDAPGQCVSNIEPPHISRLTRHRPVVIWTMNPKLVHVGQLWRALYHVPQVRHRISQYRSPHPSEGDTKVDPLSGGTGIP